jgi:hypothetical protein
MSEPATPLATDATDAFFVSRTGTRHIERGVQDSPGRVIALCGLSIRPDDSPPEAVRDCHFCAKELAIIRAERSTP